VIDATTNNVLTAAISAGAAVITAIVALLVNHRGFGLLDKRIDDTNSNLNRRIEELRSDTNSRLSLIEADIKEFFRIQADKRIQRLEDRQ
jgi:hypothetical protein